MKNKWYNLNGRLCKNPTERDFLGLSPNQIIEYRMGTNENVIIETWWVGDIADNKCIDFAYNPNELDNCILSLDSLRNSHFKNHGVYEDIHFDKCYTLPPSYFTNNKFRFPRYS